MYKWFMAGVLALAFGIAGNATAEGQQDFTLVNKTGYEIDQVYVSSAHTTDWEEDVLGQDTLGNGERVNIHFSRGTKGCSFDLRVVYTDESEAIWENIDLCTTEKITIRWNKKTGETTATID